MIHAVPPIVDNNEISDSRAIIRSLYEIEIDRMKIYKT